MNWRGGRRRERRRRRGQANNLADMVGQTALDFRDAGSTSSRSMTRRPQRQGVVGIDRKDSDALLTNDVVLNGTERVPAFVVRRQDSLKQPDRGILFLLFVHSPVPSIEYGTSIRTLARYVALFTASATSSPGRTRTQDMPPQQVETRTIVTEAAGLDAQSTPENFGGDVYSDCGIALNRRSHVGEPCIGVRSATGTTPRPECQSRALLIGPTVILHGPYPTRRYLSYTTRGIPLQFPRRFG